MGALQIIRRTGLPVLLLSLTFCLTAQQNITDARAESLGTEVTVRGIVLNGDELGSIRFVQDATAGIAAYPGTGSVGGFSSVQRGDSILLTGKLSEYNGLLEINPVTNFQILSSGLPLPEPLHLPQGDLSENVEGQLVLLPCAQFLETGSFSSGQYSLALPSGNEATLYLSSSSALTGTDIPTEATDVRGIVSEYNGQYQLLPRDADDLQAAAACLFLVEQPALSDIQPHALTFRWTTSAPAQGGIYYGTQPDLLDNYVPEAGMSTEHELSISGLQDAGFYYVRVVAESNGVEVSSPVGLYSTASLSSGSIEVYFNQSTDPSYSNGVYPAGNSYEEVEDAIIERINAAQTSISVFMYNTSRDNFVEALTDAWERGVAVRFIADDETNNSALQPPPPFPVLYGSSADGIMHNKILVIDPDDVNGAYVITGSMNMTFSNVINAYNNTLIIQDQSLARTYLREFEEMWGGSGINPNPAQARFGDEKQDNTPHQFVIGGVPVEAYFSPSDGTSSHILRALQSADEQLDFALLLFTKDDLADAIVALHQSGRNIRGLIENADEWGSEFGYLQASGISVHAHWQDGQLHHKYAIVDEGYADADPLVVTGSHNWTNSADEINDENTLIIHDADVANLFRQEFEARWTQVTAAYEPPQPRAEWKVSPNPAVDFAEVFYKRLSDEDIAWSLSDLYGHALLKGVLPAASAGHFRIDLSVLSQGTYVLAFSDGSSRILVVF